MPRWVFALAAFAGCALLGFLWAASLTRRVSVLRAWARALARMEAGLLYRARTLEELLERAVDGEGNREVQGALAACAGRMREDPLVSFSQAMGELAMPELTQQDLAALSPLFAGLGIGDVEAQRGLLRSVREAMDAQIAQAKEAEEKDRRLALSIGVIGGGAVFLFLL